MTDYYYGMKRRGFSPMCQPEDGLIKRQDDWTGKYWDILVYDHQLSRGDCDHYDLEFIGMERSRECDI